MSSGASAAGAGHVAPRKKLAAARKTIERMVEPRGTECIRCARCPPGFNPSVVIAADALQLRTLRLHGQQLRADLLFDFLRELRTLLEEFAGIVLALADALALVAVPGAGLLDDALGRAHVDDLALTRNALAVHDFEFGFAERRRHLVLHHLHARLVADDFLAVLDGTDAA